MDEGGEEEPQIVEVPEEHVEDHEHDGEVRSSDSGIGWDEHHVHDNIVPEIQIATAAEIEPSKYQEQNKIRSESTHHLTLGSVQSKARILQQNLSCI